MVRKGQLCKGMLFTVKKGLDGSGGGAENSTWTFANLNPVQNWKLEIWTFDNLTMKVIMMLTMMMLPMAMLTVMMLNMMMMMITLMTVASQFAMSSAK